MWWTKKKKEPESTKWLNDANKDFHSFIEEIMPKWKELNQKWFKKDDGFILMSSRFGKNNLTTEIEGLGMINEYFFLSIQRDVATYLQDKPYTEITEFCDALKESLLKKCFMK